METSYRYQTVAHWSSHRRGIVEAEEIPRTINFSAPPEFRGEPGLWTPEHLLVSAVATCFVTTMRAIAEMSKLEVVALETAVEGHLEKKEGGFRFTKFVLRPKLTIAREEDRELANRLLDKAEHACLISRSLNGRVEMKAEILMEEPVAAE
jgi:peroxiredoxin-like protein